MVSVNAYAFGPFELDPNRRILIRDGEIVPLAPKPFSLLLLLVRHAGQTLTKERLLNELWPETVGTEANLSVNIATVRRALGESPKDHRYIMTTPQRGYSFVAPVRRVPAAEHGRTAGSRASSGEDAAPLRRIAVLPFRMSQPGEADQSLGDGLADAVSAELSTLQHWAVQSSRTVAQHMVGTADAVTVGRRVEADMVLEGNVSTQSGRTVVEIKLLDTGNRTLLWGDIFTDAPSSVSRLPRRIGASLADVLEPAHAPGRRRPGPRPETPAFSSFQEYVKGRFLLNRADPRSVTASLDHFRRAETLDPGFALAHAGTAQGYYDLWRLGVVASDEAVPAIENAARSAVEMDPTLGEPFFWIAYLNMAHHWNWPVAESLFARGLQRSPNSCLGRTLHAYFLLLAGEDEKALEEARRAQSLEPLNLLANASVPNILRLSGHLDEALPLFEGLVTLAPDYSWGRFLLGWALLQADRPKEARTVFEELLDRTGEMPYTLACLSTIYTRLGETGRARDHHDRLLSTSDQGPLEPYVVAFSLLGLGDREGAVEWLQKAYRERNPVMAYLRLEPCWAPVRDDPRILDIISRIGAPARRS